MFFFKHTDQWFNGFGAKRFQGNNNNWTVYKVVLSFSKHTLQNKNNAEGVYWVARPNLTKNIKSTHPMVFCFAQSSIKPWPPLLIRLPTSLDSLELSGEEVEAIVEMSLRWHPLQVGVAVLALICQEIGHQEPYNTRNQHYSYIHTKCTERLQSS